MRRAATSGQRDPIGDRVERDLELGVAVLNAMLDRGVSLAVSRDAGVGAGRRSADGGRAEISATITLAASGARGGERRASRRMRLTPGRRPMLLALSSCFAECAMDLGLGASVCRGYATETT